MPKRKVKWVPGDVFVIPLCDGRVAIGQVLDLMMVNQVRVALYDETFPSPEAIVLAQSCQPEHLVSLITSSREQLDYGVWKIVGNRPVLVPLPQYPNEQFRAQGWVGAKHYDAALVEDFMEAFYALRPWDNWFDPNYFDAFLISPSKKPNRLLLVKS